MHLTSDNQCKVCDSIVVRGSIRAAAACIGATEQTLHRWLNASRRDADQRLEAQSKHWFRWLDADNYFHVHVNTARKHNVIAASLMMLDQTTNGIEEICYDPSTGRPLLALAPMFIGVTDEAMIEQGYDPNIDRYLWEYDEIGLRVRPIYQTKFTSIPATLRAKTMAAMLPHVWGDHATIDHNIAGQVVHRIEPPVFIPRAERLAQQKKQIEHKSDDADAIDGDFTEVEPAAPVVERPDIAELRKRAEALMRDGPAHPVPDGIVKDASGLPVNVGRKPTVNDAPDDVPLQKPTVPLDQHPRAYQATHVKPYQRDRRGYPPGRDPHAPGAHAMKVG